MKHNSDTNNLALEMEGEGATIDPDGHEGDDERTSGQSGSEMVDKDGEEKTTGQQVGSSDAPSLAPTDVKPMQIQKKHRRGSRRNRKKYKPYTKMTWDEKRAKLELDAKKATKMREQYTNEKGRPAAPYNTTQFLMEEHDREEPDLGNHLHMQSDSEGDDDESGDSMGRRLRQDSHSLDDSDLEDYNESPEDGIYEKNFFEKDFTEAYEQCHAESLYSMKKDDLVRECMSLEERVETLERQLRQIHGIDNGALQNGSTDQLPTSTNNISNDKLRDGRNSQELVRALQSELNRLKSENAQLQLEKCSNLKTLCIENSA